VNNVLQVTNWRQGLLSVETHEEESLYTTCIWLASLLPSILHIRAENLFKTRIASQSTVQSAAPYSAVPTQNV
jgi:hypothetical protein